MKERFRIRPIDAMVVLAIIGYAGWRSMNRAPETGDSPKTPAQQVDLAFAQQVDLTPLYKTAVQADGRLRSFESHAKRSMGIIAGARSIQGQSNGFTYLDLMLRGQAYDETELIYVKHKDVRRQILDVLAGHGDIDGQQREAIQKRGLFSRKMLMHPVVGALMERLGKDLIRTSKVVDAIHFALNASHDRFLAQNLRLIAPPGGAIDTPWFSITALEQSGGAPRDDIHAGLQTASTIPGLDEQLSENLTEAWSSLRAGWRSRDATAVNTQVEKLAQLLPLVAPNLYPSLGRLGMESWYFRSKSMTWVWLLYLACVIPLLMSVIYKWDRARTAGLVLFVLAFAAHTASIGIRWYISGRWPNSNMFEALTTSAWFGGVGALVLERIARRTPLRNLFALGSAVMSMVALMAAYFLPVQLDSGISNKMAALNDVWLYIHTNMIIWSYAMIALACVPALLQLRHRWCASWDRSTIPRARLLLLPIALVVLNYTGYRLLMHVLDDPARQLSGNTLMGTSGAFWGSLMIVLLEALAVKTRNAAGAKVERSASGGASALIGGGGASFLTKDRPTAGEVFDGATMVLVELSFIMLWTGLVMGAIWADHSWGRPWGWDPKEVFALNTFIIFLVLIHVRLKVRDKGFWTAILAVFGFEVMMFNWIVVNFVITGLHSYA